VSRQTERSPAAALPLLGPRPARHRVGAAAAVRGALPLRQRLQRRLVLPLQPANLGGETQRRLLAEGVHRAAQHVERVLGDVLLVIEQVVRHVGEHLVHAQKRAQLRRGRRRAERACSRLLLTVSEGAGRR